jgi:DNA (cytosine-5)-methyltransferase 1
LSLGFEQVGFEIAAAVEYDPVHAATHHFNFPGCEVLCRDVSRLAAPDVLAAAGRGLQRLDPGRKWDGQIDALIGGPPCQGFSTGGKRESDDSRNGLLMQFVRLVDELRPAVFCLENVAGLLEPRFETLRVQALRRLMTAGYRIVGSDETVNCVDFGIPQNRRRLVILGSLGGTPSPCVALPSAVTTVGDAFQGLPKIGEYDDLLSSDVCQLTNADQTKRSEITSRYARELAGFVRPSADKSRPRTWDPATITNSRRTRHSSEVITRFAATKPGEVEPTSRLYRLADDRPARTLRAGTGAERGAHTSPRPIHPVEDRVITVREAARLHGYPDWFRFHTTNWHGHRQVGNSVPPPLARAAARSLLDILGCSPVARRTPAKSADEQLLCLSRREACTVLDVRPGELPSGRQPQPQEPKPKPTEVGLPPAA